MMEEMQRSAFQWRLFQWYQGTSFQNHCVISEGNLQYYFPNLNKEKINHGAGIIIPKPLQENPTHRTFLVCRFFSVLRWDCREASGAEHPVDLGVDSEPVSPCLACYPLRWTSLIKPMTPNDRVQLATLLPTTYFSIAEHPISPGYISDLQQPLELTCIFSTFRRTLPPMAPIVCKNHKKTKTEQAFQVLYKYTYILKLPCCVW